MSRADRESAKEALSDYEDDSSNEQFEEFSGDEFLDDEFLNELFMSQNYVQGLPLDVQQRVQELQKLQEQQNKVHQEYLAELLKLQKKYEEECTPLLDQRKAIVIGEVEPSESDIERGNSSLPDELSTTPFPHGENATEKGVPDFWSCALDRVPLIRMTRSERDKEALAYLIDIRSKSSEESPSAGFTLSFEFGENPFFEEKVLTKEYVKKPCVPNGLGEWYLAEVKSTSISWKSDEMNLTMEAVRKKQRNKKTNEIRFALVYEPCSSFFDFFRTLQCTSNSTRAERERMEIESQGADIDIAQIEHEELREIVDEDWEIGLSIKEGVIPRAAHLFSLGDSSDSEFEDEFEGDFFESDFEDMSSADLTNRIVSRDSGNQKTNQDNCPQQ